MITAIIIGDADFQTQLKKQLEKNRNIQIIGEMADEHDATAFLCAHTIDLIFLHVQNKTHDSIVAMNDIMACKNNADMILCIGNAEKQLNYYKMDKKYTFKIQPVSLERIGFEDEGAADLKNLEVSCFSKFKVLENGNEVKFRTQKAEEMFAYFIDRKGKFVSRSVMIDALWNDYDGDKANILFNTTLYYMKKAFKTPLDIIHERGAYALKTEKITCDYFDFTDSFSVTEEIKDENKKKYLKAVESYTGDYLETEHYGWSGQTRANLKERFLRLNLVLAKYYLTREPYKAVEFVKKGLMVEPIDRDMNFTLIKLYCQQNDMVSMIKHYQVYCEKLQSDYNILPDNEITEFIEIAKAFQKKQ